MSNTIAYTCYACESTTGCEHMTPRPNATAQEVAAYKADRRFVSANYRAAAAQWSARRDAEQALQRLERQQAARYSKAREKAIAKLEQEIRASYTDGDIPARVNDACKRIQAFRQRFWGSWHFAPGNKSRHNYAQHWYRSYGRQQPRQTTA